MSAEVVVGTVDYSPEISFITWQTD
jgi:hypothetical protein